MKIYNYEFFNGERLLQKTSFPKKPIQKQIQSNKTCHEKILKILNYFFVNVFDLMIMRQLLSFYSWFYEVTMLESTNAISERKMQMYF